MFDDRKRCQSILQRFNRRVRHAVAQGRYDVALRASDRAVARLALDQPASELDRIAAETWSIRGEVLELDDRLQEALLARERGVLLAERVGLPPSALATTLAQVAQNLRLLDRNAEANDRLAQAKTLISNAPKHEDGDRDLLRARCVLTSVEADLLCDSDENERAETLKAQALTGWHDLYPASEYPDGHADLANAITDYGWIAGEMNDDVAMSDRYEEALAANERLYPASTHPIGHPDLANAYNNVAFARMQLGRYIEAELFYAKAVRLREGLYPPSRFPNGRAEMAVSHMNLGELLMRRGDLFRARQHYSLALSIREKVFPESAYPDGHTDLLRTILALGRLQVESEDAASALPLYERAEAMARALYPDAGARSGHAIYAWVMHDYGRALMLSERDDQATRVLEEADRLFSRSSTVNFLHASTLAALGELRARQGEVEACRAYCLRARDMYEAAYPSADYEAGHSNLATGLARLARVALLIDDTESARPLILEAQRTFRGIAETFFMDSAMMEGLLLRAQLARLPALLLSINVEGGWREAYETVFQTKGAVRRAHGLRAICLRERGRDAAPEAKSELRLLRANLARLLFAPFDNRFAARRRERFNELIEIKELLEQRIARLARPEPCPPFEAADARAFYGRMPRDFVFLDMVRFARTTRAAHGKRNILSESEEYSVFVVAQGGVVARVDIGAATEVDALVEGWRYDIESGTDAAAATKVSERVWEPIKAVLPPGTRLILISPDGGLHRLPWLALEDEPGVPVVENHSLVLMTEPWLSSLERPDQVESLPALVVGDVAYGPRPGQGARRRPHWAALADGRRELEEVTDRAGTAIVLKGTGATADALLALMRGKRLIHVITHGFYIDPASKRHFDFDPELVDPLSGANQKERRSARRQSPLLSGLVLAAANDWPEVDAAGLPTGERSILTAEEIAGADVSAADLVVLSACETNLGDVMSGEGVLGLRVAFHEAGARCVVSSLWPVGDAATATLMKGLYENLRTGAVSAPEALRRAQLSQIKEDRLDGRRPDTRDWAGFMASASSWDCFDALSLSQGTEAG